MRFKAFIFGTMSSGPACLFQPRGRHVRLRHHVARVVQVGAVPFIAVAGAHAGQVGPVRLEPHWKGWS
jgi:hypothetical protein